MPTILARFNGRTLATAAEAPRLPCLHNLNQYYSDHCDVKSCADRCEGKSCHNLHDCRNESCRAGLGEWCREMVQAEVRERLERESTVVVEVT